MSRLVAARCPRRRRAGVALAGRRRPWAVQVTLRRSEVLVGRPYADRSMRARLFLDPPLRGSIPPASYPPAHPFPPGGDLAPLPELAHERGRSSASRRFLLGSRGALLRSNPIPRVGGPRPPFRLRARRGGGNSAARGAPLIWCPASAASHPACCGLPAGAQFAVRPSNDWPDFRDAALVLATPVLAGVFESRQTFVWAGRPISVVSLEGLARMKRLAGRHQDLADLEKLGVGRGEE